MTKHFILGILGGLGAPELIIILLFFAVPLCILVYQLTRTDTETDFTVSASTKYAGFWFRLIAAFIDGLLIFIAATITWTIFDLPIPSDAQGPYFGQWYVFRSPVVWLFTWLYHALFEVSPWQGSIGKRLLGLRVTDKLGKSIGFWRASGRYWAKFLSLFTFYIGFIMIAFTKRKQGLHDKVANCLVVRPRSSHHELTKEIATHTSEQNRENSGDSAPCHQNMIDSVADIEKKEKLLFSSLKNNLISDTEYSVKSKQLKDEKVRIILERKKGEVKQAAIQNIAEKAKQLKDLVGAGLLTDIEYSSKYELLLKSEMQRLTELQSKQEVPKTSETKETSTKTAQVYPPTKSMVEADENIKRMEEVIKRLKDGKGEK